MLENILKEIWNVLVMQETVAGHDISEIEAQYARVWAEQDADLLNWDHPSARVIGKVVDTRETENGLEVTVDTRETENGLEITVEHSDTEDSDEGLYGIPEVKKYPMPDKKHVKSAIRFFNYVDPKYEKELAEAILEKAEEFGLDLEEDITVGDDNRFKKYLSKDHSEHHDTQE